jgi:hypothetical protein
MTPPDKLMSFRNRHLDELDAQELLLIADEIGRENGRLWAAISMLSDDSLSPKQRRNIIEPYKHSETKGVGFGSVLQANDIRGIADQARAKHSEVNSCKCERWCGLPNGHAGECTATFTRDISAKTSGAKE